MSEKIFAAHAPLYWSHNIPVTPVEPGTKRPAMTGWQGFVTGAPSPEKQAVLLDKYGGHSIGLLTGFESEPGVQVFALDIDDERLTKVALEAIGGVAPCATRGKTAACCCSISGKCR